MIPPFYHAFQHLTQAVKDVKLPANWLDKQQQRLQEGRVNRVLQAVAKLPNMAPEHLAKLRNYSENNIHRMDYAAYRKCGYDIGSGAIEAAHKTLIQVRMKRSGQRWSPEKAPLMLKLRVAYKSQLWKTVEQTVQ